jgi:uncharacterized protein involved in exopolysaccharide biosynthesis
VLFKHKRLITAVFLAIVLPVLIYLLVTPTKYVATAKVLVNSSRDYLGLSPAAGANLLVISGSTETINAEIQIIQSAELRKRLAKEMGRRSLAPLKAVPIKGSRLIGINFESSDPKFAVQAVNKAAELYLEQHLETHKIQGVEEFYDEQDKKLQMELTKAEAVLEEYEEREKIVDPEHQLTSNLARLAVFETTLRNTESSIRESNEKIRALEAQLKDQKPAISGSEQVSVNPVYDKMRDRLIQLQLERDSLLQRYTPSDRIVGDKEKEIGDLNKKLAVILSDPKSVWSTNPVHQGILNSLLTARADLPALEAKRASLVKQVATYSSDTAELKQKTFAYDRLRQEVNARKGALALYKKKAEEARISNAMDERKFGNVTIFERAASPLRPAGFDPLLILLAAVIASLGIAVGVPFAIEFCNPALRNEIDLEERIGIPVLATIPDYRAAPKRNMLQLFWSKDAV